MIKIFRSETDFIKLQENEGLIFHKIYGNGIDFTDPKLGFSIEVLDQKGKTFQKKVFKQFGQYLDPVNIQTGIIEMVFPVLNYENGLTTVIRVSNLKKSEQLHCEYELVSKKTLA